MWKHLILPHPHTHKKAHLISWQAFVVYITLFALLQIGISIYSKINPGVLGVSSVISQQELIKFTNAEREKKGLPALVEDPRLNEAALKKGENMFEENYWAHYSPTGKDPWGFISKAGYNFSYAGENLARNFYSPKDVVDAWMASPSHRDNIINTRYKNIGIAVLEGNLNGQRTVLVVQELGAPVDYIADVPSFETQVTTVTSNTPVKAQDIRIAGEVIADPHLIIKYTGLGILFLIVVLIVVDLYIMRRRMVHRLASHHVPHLALLSLSMSTLFNTTPGSIL